MNFNQITDVVEATLTSKGKTIIGLSETVREILTEIATVYWRPISPQDVAEIILEIFFRDEKRIDVAILDWSIDKEENGYDLSMASALNAETCNWGIVADNLLPQPKGWTTASAVRFVGHDKSLADVLEIAEVLIDAYQADVRIYSLPLDYDDREGVFRQQFGDVGIPVVSLSKDEMDVQ
jgi:hypothetical protein